MEAASRSMRAATGPYSASAPGFRRERKMTIGMVSFSGGRQNSPPQPRGSLLRQENARGKTPRAPLAHRDEVEFPRGTRLRCLRPAVRARHLGLARLQGQLLHAPVQHLGDIELVLA